MEPESVVSLVDLATFLLYYLSIIVLGAYLSKRQKTDSADYFLARKKLPWYVIGASIISSNISTEHFIGMVGWAYLYGVAVASWEWGNWFTFSLLIWVFLPFYMRGGLYTMPEFLQRRFNPESRYLFAVATLTQYVLAMMAAVLFAGGTALHGMFGLDVEAGILLLAAAAGVYTIWGGLFSAVWIEFVQFAVLMSSGLLVSILALTKTGGLAGLARDLPEKFTIFLPPTHEMIPWTGLLGAFLSIGVWYNCTNQFIVQRCLGAKTEWDGRMGVVFAGFAKIVLPLVLVIPGIAAFRLFGAQLSGQPDLAYPLLVKRLLGPGLIGIVMAGLAAAIMSTVSSALNSTSTILTLDLYRPLVNPQASEERLIRIGRTAGSASLLLATLLALWYAANPGLTVFGLIQNIGAWVAAPVSAVFLCGILWRGVTGQAASTVLIFGFPFTWFVDQIVFAHDILKPYANFLHRTLVVWLVCVALLMVISLSARHRTALRVAWGVFYVSLLGVALAATGSGWVLAVGLPLGIACQAAIHHSRTPPMEEIEKIVWKPSDTRLASEPGRQDRGVRSSLLWWALFVGLTLALYAGLLLFQLGGR